MKTLIIKIGATGDVVRTTPLLTQLPGEVVWLSECKNLPLLNGVWGNLKALAWEERDLLETDRYDLIVNLEDSFEVGEYVGGLQARRLFGAYLEQGVLRYTDDSRAWFDLSLISRHGRREADRLKYLNRLTYQELIFTGLGFSFQGQKYLLPDSGSTNLSGDVAIASEAGPVWPMKTWAYFAELTQELKARGLTVNILPRRSSLLAHLADVRGHSFLVSGDSLPMHFALGSGIKCLSLFTCTSPWEIYGYGVQQKLVSPSLHEFFYKRNFDVRATTAIPLDDVVKGVAAFCSGAHSERSLQSAN